MSKALVMSWHGKVDKNGNAICLKCKRVQASTFSACIYCCSHDTLEFTEEYDCGWHLSVACSICDKNFDFNNTELIANYKVVRRSGDDSGRKNKRKKVSDHGESRRR